MNVLCVYIYIYMYMCVCVYIYIITFWSLLSQFRFSFMCRELSPACKLHFWWWLDSRYHLGISWSAGSSASADQLIPGWAAHWDGVIQAPVDHLHIQTQRHNELGTGTDSLRISTGTAAWQMLGKCLADAWLTWPLLHSHCFLFCAKSITVKVSGSLAHLPHLSLPMFWQSQSAQQKNL